MMNLLKIVKPINVKDIKITIFQFSKAINNLYHSIILEDV